MSFTKIFEERDSFEIFKRILPDRWSLDLSESDQYKFFKGVGQEFMLLYMSGRLLALSRWLGAPFTAPNVEPTEIEADTPHIKILSAGGVSLNGLGSLLNSPIYDIVNEREQSYRQRLIGTVQGIFGGGTKPHIISALEFATKRFDGVGANQDGYTPEIIEPFTPKFKWGTLAQPPDPTLYDNNYFHWGTLINVPPSNAPLYDLFGLSNDYSKWGAEDTFDPQVLHFIVKFLMDDNIGSGIHVAEYSFTEDTIGVIPTDWTFIVQNSNCDAKVIAEFMNKKKVLELEDNNPSGRVEVQHALAITQSNGGEIELLIATTNISKRLRFYSNATTGEEAFDIEIRSNEFRAGGDIITEIIPASNTWFHVRFQFEVSAGGYAGLAQETFRIFINDIDCGVHDFWEKGFVNDIKNLRFNTITGEVNYKGYLDALDFSWSSGWYEGRNKRQTQPTDYEYWGGFYINSFDINFFNQVYVNNYLFLRDVVQAIKLGGVTFEIRIEVL